MNAANWLRVEDARNFEDRVSRLNWLVEHSPMDDYWSFPGGVGAKSLFEEARYCFVYGQFLATELLGLAYMERTLAALFYAAGRTDLERASLSKLLAEARKGGLINESEFDALERIRNQRNTYAHFRKPGHPDGLEYRSIQEGELPYDIIERDATEVIAAVLRMLEKQSI